MGYPMYQRNKLEKSIFLIQGKLGIFQVLVIFFNLPFPKHLEIPSIKITFCKRKGPNEAYFHDFIKIQLLGIGGGGGGAIILIIQNFDLAKNGMNG